MKKILFLDDNNEMEDFKFNQDLELDNDTKRSPGWMRYQKRLK